MRKLILISICFLMLKPAVAQQLPSPYDAISYDLLTAGQWNDLVRVSEKAIAEGFAYDYFYMRAGYGYFNQGNYMMSAWYYRKALDICTDKTLRESILYYLYYSHLYSGQYSTALRYTENMSTETQYAVNAIKPSVVHLINAEAGIKFSSDESLYKSLYYYQAGAGFRAGRKTTGYLSGSMLNQETYYGNMQQIQLYGGLTFALKNNWSFSPSVHLLQVSYTNLSAGLSESDFKSTPLLLHAGVGKTWKKWDLRFSSSWSELNKTTQFQQQFSANWFPFGNNKLQVGAAISYLNDNATGYVLPGVNMRYWFGNHLSVYGSYLYANSKNFSEQNGWLITNSFDLTLHRLQAGIEVPVYKTFSLYGIYQYEGKTETISNKDYSLNMPVIGIKLIK